MSADASVLCTPAQEETDRKVCTEVCHPCLTHTVQAAAAARIAGKAPRDIIVAAMEGDISRVQDHLTVDASRVNERGA